MPRSISFPKLNASFSEYPGTNPAGLLVSQSGRSYFAKGHLLSEGTVKIIQAAVDAGLTAFWKYGHPSDAYFQGGDRFEAGAHQLQFSRNHNSPWTFVIGAENKPPYPNTVTFNSKLKPVLDAAARENGLNAAFEYQVVGGKNITVDLDKLAFALTVCADEEVQSFLAARSPRRIPTPRCPAYVSENQLQAAIAEELTARGFTVRREVNLGVGRVDLVATTGSRHFVIEIKPHSTGRPVFDQVDRYHRAYGEALSSDSTKPEAVLVARHYQDDLLSHVKSVGSALKLVTYEVSPSGTLVFTEIGLPYGSSILNA